LRDAEDVIPFEVNYHFVVGRRLAAAEQKVFV